MMLQPYSDPRFPGDTVAPTPLGGLRPNGGKYGPFVMGARERSRLAWRQRVDAAPRPWRSPRKPDPRRRYSRSHRRACKWCRGGMEWLVLARRAESCGLFGLGCFRRDMYRNWRRNPHGRSGR